MCITRVRQHAEVSRKAGDELQGFITDLFGVLRNIDNVTSKYSFCFISIQKVSLTAARKLHHRVCPGRVLRTNCRHVKTFFQACESKFASGEETQTHRFCFSSSCFSYAQ